MCDVVILAGGNSSRAKTNKILLPFNNVPLICHTVQMVKKFAKKVIVVTGKFDREIRDALDDIDGVTIVTNSNYDLGMFSSVKEGVKLVENDFFILPGDAPFILEETFKKLSKTKKMISIPNYKGQDGHPIFIKFALASALLKTDINLNLKLFKDNYDVDVIKVNDKNVINDIDTIEEYEKLLKERN